MLAALMLVSAVPALVPPPLPQGPTQVIRTAESPAQFPLGDQGAVDGLTAVALSGVATGVAVEPPGRQVLFFERDSGTGSWSVSQSISLPSVVRGLSGGSVDIEGDIAVVHAGTTGPSPFGVYSRLFIFERDASGTWSESQTFSASFPGADLGVITTVHLDGGDLIVGDKTVPGARILRRSSGSGTWGETQTVSIPLPGFIEVNDVIVDDGLLVLIDPLTPVFVYERDASGVWAAAGSIERPGAFFVTANATDGERIVLPRVTSQPQFAGALDVYFRPDPAQPTTWALEQSVDLAAGATVGLLVQGSTSIRQQLFFENGQILASRGSSCGASGAAQVTVLTENAATGAFEVVESLCSLTAGRRLLDYDGVWALTGDVAVPGPFAGDLPGALQLVDVAASSGDCDLDGTPDMMQLASCSDCDLNLNGVIDVCEPTGLVLCALDTPNTSGKIARLFAYGDPAAGGDPIVFRAVDTSLNTFGLLASGSGGSTPVAVGNGFLCIRGPQLGRFVNQVGDTGPTGTWSVLADPNAIPTASGPISLMAGTTWFFQAIFRDGAALQLTNSVALFF